MLSDNAASISYIPLSGPTLFRAIDNSLIPDGFFRQLNSFCVDSSLDENFLFWNLCKHESGIAIVDRSWLLLHLLQLIGQSFDIRIDLLIILLAKRYSMVDAGHPIFDVLEVKQKSIILSFDSFLLSLVSFHVQFQFFLMRFVQYTVMLFHRGCQLLFFLIVGYLHPQFIVLIFLFHQF